MEDLANLLDLWNTDEVMGLADILGVRTTSEEVIAQTFAKNAQSGITYRLGRKLTYRQVVAGIARKMAVPAADDAPVERLEQGISQAFFAKMIEKLSPEQRTDLELRLREVAQEYDKTGTLVRSGSLVAALAAGKLSGFGIYLLASTSLGALSGAVGVTLPFVVYTTMSKAISVIIGPAGWIGLGLLTLFKLTAPNEQKTTAAIIYICMIRARRLENLGFLDRSG